MKLLGSVVVCLLFISGCTTIRSPNIPPLPSDAVRPVVAVTEFENETGFAGHWHLGRGMADLLVAELIETDRFIVVDRRKLDAVLGELVRQSRDLFRKEGRVEKGRLKNARYLVRGVITDFTQTGSSSAWFRNSSVNVGGRGSKAVVMVAITVTDVETGEIISCVRAGGTAKASSKWASFDYRNTAFGGDFFYSTPIGRATSEAIEEAVVQLVRDIPIETWHPRIAEFRSGTAVINGGRNVNIQVGDTFDVLEESRNITDPSTGDVIGVVPGRTVGRIRVISVGEMTSDAMVLDGTVKRGYRLEHTGRLQKRSP